MINQTNITAAYGRKYNTLDQALTDWNKGLDFKICSGPYCSKRDFNILDSIYVMILGNPVKLQ